MNFITSCYIFIIGTVLGSFYGVVGSRLPKKESLLHPGSHCEFCNHSLKWYELIPVFSYLFQLGKCRKCHKSLPLTYLTTELFCGILFVLSYFQFGFSPSFFISCILSSLVVIIFVSDMLYMIILDSPLIISSGMIIITLLITKGISQAGIAIMSGVGSFLTILLIGKLGNILFKKESLGGGDIKLSFVIGLSLGYKMAMFSFIFATFLALPYAIVCLFLKEGHEVPFGPFLVSAMWIVFFFFEKFILIWNYFFYI